MPEGKSDSDDGACVSVCDVRADASMHPFLYRSLCNRFATALLTSARS